MKYKQVEFLVVPASETAADVLAAILADIGFETFVPSATGLIAYIQQTAFSDFALAEAVCAFPMPGVAISYTVGDAPDEDWNATWEAGGFEPIIVGGRLCVYDDRTASPPPTALIHIPIRPRQAFGSGTHATTRLMLARLCSMPVQNKRVIDAGCGTGILGIAAMRLGAASLTAYDIDEWSVKNTQLNCSLNGVSNGDIRLGDVSVLSPADTADIITANINRNILMADMAVFAKHLAPEGHLLLSGFMEADVPLLTMAAEPYGLQPCHHECSGEWHLVDLHLT